MVVLKIFILVFVRRAMPFATLDDATRNHKGMPVYAHALVLANGDVKTLVLVGDIEKEAREKAIYSFVKRYLAEEEGLIACAHYTQYPSLFDTMYMSINKRNMAHFSKKVQAAYMKADTKSKNAAKDKIVEITSKQEERQKKKRKLQSLELQLGLV